MNNAMLKRLVTNLPLIFGLYFVSLVVASALLVWAEGLQEEDGIWLSVVTALTIGYGDLFPKTGVGRVIVAVFGHVWVMGMIPLLVANIILKVIPDPNEFTHAEQEELKAAQREMRDSMQEMLGRMRSFSHTEYKVNGMKIDESHPDYGKVTKLFQDLDPVFAHAQSLINQASDLLRRIRL